MYNILGYQAETGSAKYLPGAWADATAEIIECLEEPVLPKLLARALNTLLPFEHCEQMVYRHNANPILVYDGEIEARYAPGITNYLKSSYLIDPVYRMYCAGMRSGAYRVRDLAKSCGTNSDDPAKYRASPKADEEIGHLTNSWLAGREEVCLTLEMQGEECAAITLARKRGDRGFSAGEIEQLRTVIPFLAAAFRRHWRQARFTHTAAERKTVLGIGSLTGTLSPREREIALLLLRGNSTLSISLRLGISISTVKTHRKNLYAKLGIATQFELFTLFTDSVGDRLHG